MELTDIRLRSIMHLDPIKGWEPIQKIKYFRLPGTSEYPLNLNCGSEKQMKQLLHKTDFILQRRLLYYFIDAQPVDQRTPDRRFEAFRFKGCIYIKLLEEEARNQATLRDSYAFKARQYFMTERLGGPPDMFTPVDEMVQQYGIFSAKVGQFRLLYSGELTGVCNTQYVGDLTNRGQLDKCRLTKIKIVNSPIYSRSNFRFCSWVRQAYLSGIDQIAIAKFEKDGMVVQPIEVESVRTLLQGNRRLNMGGRVQRMHQFLEKIRDKLQDLDNPNATIKLMANGDTLVFEESLDTAFISYVIEL
ncbi:hypothetical protein KR038_008076 [Drosophila bunnanda]|nr:hypothetical protein KR038_008076 [Drosophila bunnanda]